MGAQDVSAATPAPKAELEVASDLARRGLLLSPLLIVIAALWQGTAGAVGAAARRRVGAGQSGGALREAEEPRLVLALGEHRKQRAIDDAFSAEEHGHSHQSENQQAERPAPSGQKGCGAGVG